MARFKRVNGVRIQFTAEEEAARDAEEAEQVIERQQRDAEFAQKATDKTKTKKRGPAARDSIE